MVQKMDSLKERALQYAKKGFKVFPLYPNSKSQQVLRSWINEATNDFEQIRKWWNENPNYNIGLVTGNGLMVIDVDVKNGKDGIASLKQHGKELPTTATVRTPTGGLHMYYHVEDKISNRVN